MKELIRPNRPIGTAEVSRLLQAESPARDTSRAADWRASIGGDPSRLIAAYGSSHEDLPDQVVQYGQMLVIRPLAQGQDGKDGTSRAPAFGDAREGREAQTILVMVDSVAERDRIVRLLTERREDGEGTGQDTRDGHDARQARPVAEYDELRIDFAAHRVSVNGQPITTLTTLEFRLLSTLVERIDCVQSRSTLLRDVWGVNANTATRTVDVHIKRLRDKIGSARRFIECVRGVGYRFTHTPTIAASQANAAAQIQ
ncbi:MAG: winged helix-turn-helix domain-containing protein [Polyangiales bacterium]